MENTIVFYFSYGWRISKTAVSAIAIVIAVVGVTGATMAQYTISGAQTLFGVC